MTYTPGNDNVERVILAEIEVGHRIDTHSWIQEASPYPDAWYISHTHTDKFGEHEGAPSRVTENGTELDEVESIDYCHLTSGSWYWDAENQLLYVHTTGDDDPGSGDYVIVAFIWRRFATKPYIFGSRPYIPLISPGSIPEIAYVTGGYHEGGTKQTFGSISFLNGEGYFDTDLSDYIYEGKRVKVRIGEDGNPDADFAVFWDGWTSDITWTETEVEITIEDLMTAII